MRLERRLTLQVTAFGDGVANGAVPGLASMRLALAANLLSDALCDALDPQLRSWS